MNPNDFAPPDKSSASPILQAAAALVETLRKPGCESPEVALLLGDAEWRSLEAEHRRPYRPHSSEVYMPVEGGGAVRFRRAPTTNYEAVELKERALAGRLQVAEDAVRAEPRLTADEVVRLRRLLRLAETTSITVPADQPTLHPPSWQATITGILPDVDCPATFAGAKCAGQHGAVVNPRHRGQDASGAWVEWGDGKGWTPGEIARQATATAARVLAEEGAPPGVYATPAGPSRMPPAPEGLYGHGGTAQAEGSGRLYEAKLSGVEFASSDPYPKEGR